ncbi:unnamed protein product [Somion occarium]|uniref:NACHT-NTPase and P-loop NTPases N-terminal domain-containing protein n=1 Tax=Somion occarium TaxID=3059160 RepID=A0ABP1ECR3_9APHY
MSVALTFGSFGDIVSLVQVATSLVRALTSTAGASESYQGLVLDVTRLLDVLPQLDRAVSNDPANDQRERILSNADLSAWVTQCRLSLGRILRRVSYYQSLIETRDAGRASWRTTWLKVGWMLFKHAEIEQYRAELRDHNAKLGTILATMNGDCLRIVRHAVVRAGNDTEDISSQTAAINCNVILALQLLQSIDGRMTIPDELGHPWNTEHAQGFEDVYGRKFIIPRELCFSMEMFRDIASWILRPRGKYYSECTYIWPYYQNKEVGSTDWLMLQDYLEAHGDTIITMSILVYIIFDSIDGPSGSVVSSTSQTSIGRISPVACVERRLRWRIRGNGRIEIGL